MQPDFPFQTAQTAANPLGLFGQQRPKTMIIDNRFAAAMESKGDPRQEAYMAFDGDAWLFYTAPTGGLFWSSFDSPMPLISNTEVRFLEAEALLRTGNVSGAEEALAEAISSNMSYLGVDGADYVAAFGNFLGLSTDEQRLQRIIEEKYFALFAQGSTEIWTDYRRTGYPALVPNPQGVNGGNPSGVVPRRFRYPFDEVRANGTNVEAAISRQGGSDLLDADLWAFK
jgi:hypothetical protein